MNMDDIDLNFLQLSRQQVLQRYTLVIRQLRQLAEENYGVRPMLFDNYVMCHYFRQRSANFIQARSSRTALYLKRELFNHILDRRRQIICWFFYLALLSLCVAAYRYDAAAGANERMVQSFAYPSMRIWRRMTMPIIQRFPRLTELYDESCLMGNPFFQLEDLSCRPCANVENVWFESEECVAREPVEDIGIDSKQQDDGHVDVAVDINSDVQCQIPPEHVPFVFKSNQNPVELIDFYHIYANNHKIFQRDAYRVHSTSQDVHNLEDLFGQFNSSVSSSTSSPKNAGNSNNRKLVHAKQAHNLWRCNRMLPARLLRPIFARPSRLPSMGVALERYIAIDTPQAPAYSLPKTECPNVFVHQAVGTRFIILRPTSECRHRCRTLSMRLTQSFVLSYNWLYWKPISAPDPISETLSISLIGSYC